MYFEEKLIDGVLCWRNTPHSAFVPYTVKELSLKYLELKYGVSYDQA